MSTQETFELMARYNHWMNEKVLRVCGKLSQAALVENRGAFFHSILGTLNHMMVGDTIWLKRFATHPQGYQSLCEMMTAPTPASLDATLFDDLASLTPARRQLDDTIVAWALEMADAELEESFHYANSKGQKFTHKFAQVVQHFFNHQTHHRGQITTLLSQVGQDVGSTDLMGYMRLGR